MMSEQQFEQRWAELQAAECNDLAQEQARARAQPAILSPGALAGPT
jgi:hypothetical protein